MERALADLLTRITDGPARHSRPILLSTHSQGTVIGAALLMSLEASISSRVCFLTYGSPLRRLYATFFPAYFSAYALGRLGQFLSDSGWTNSTPFDSSAETRKNWRWHNLYRSSDPIGGPIFAGYVSHPDIDTDVDWWLRDPVFAKQPGDPTFPPTYGHSDYQFDPAYARARKALIER